MSENNLRRIWSPADYEETKRDAAKHRAEPAAEDMTPDVAPIAHGITPEAKWIPIHTAEPQSAADVGLTVRDKAIEASYHYAIAGRGPLPYRRNPTLACLLCFAPALAPCASYCLALLPAAEQIEHQQAVLDRTIAELDGRLGTVEGAPWAKRADPDFVDADDYTVLSCTVAGRHRVRADPWRRVRRLRAVIAVAAVVLVLALGALWASQRAGADTFTVCPSGMTGVATADTSCAFAEGVRSAFYSQVGWTVFAYSPVTSKFYTMQCASAVTTTSWWNPKRCYGINDAGVALVVYVA